MQDCSFWGLLFAVWKPALPLSLGMALLFIIGLYTLLFRKPRSTDTKWGRYVLIGTLLFLGFAQAQTIYGMVDITNRLTGLPCGEAYKRIADARQALPWARDQN